VVGNSENPREIVSDFLVIGSGIAGLSYALKVAQHGSVCLITKKQDTESNTNYAQGGIACVLSPDDSFQEHTADTLKAGVGLCKESTVKKVVEAGPRLIQELESSGINFTREQSGRLHLSREGGHSKSRVVHIQDATGRTIERVLLERIANDGNIRVFQNHLAIDFLTQHHLPGYEISAGQEINCWGAYVLNAESSQIKKFLAKITMLASGGSSQIYQHSTNPEIATGDGVAMAYRAGAEIANLEFFQFHPTTLYHPQAKNFLISETVRGEGGKLRLKDGEPFLTKYHPQADLAPRDIVARSIDAELKRSGGKCVYLDLTQMDKKFIRTRFPNIFNSCLELGIDISSAWIPVVPAAHYMCGGVLADEYGKTSIENLYACGETASTCMHGANRLASNSLLEGLAFADFSAQDSAGSLQKQSDFSFPEFPDWSEEGVFDHKEWVVISHDREEIQKLMWDYVGIVRSCRRLERAQARLTMLLSEIENFYKHNPVTYELIELRNMATLADLVVCSALQRRESRGLHFNQDYPQRDDKNFLKDTIIKNPKL
jgi:L-aspartate oxidase